MEFKLGKEKLVLSASFLKAYELFFAIFTKTPLRLHASGWMFSLAAVDKDLSPSKMPCKRQWCVSACAYQNV